MFMTSSNKARFLTLALSLSSQACRRGRRLKYAVECTPLSRALKWDWDQLILEVLYTVPIFAQKVSSRLGRQLADFSEHFQANSIMNKINPQIALEYCASLIP